MANKSTKEVKNNYTIENVEIPRKFSGTFYFTNHDSEDFTAYWNKFAYTFKAHSRSPIVMYDEPLVNIQEIRKKWAIQLAERMHHKSAKFKELLKKSEGKAVPFNYSDKELEPYIQLCLEDAPLVEVDIEKVPEKVVTKTIDPKTGHETTRAFDDMPNLTGFAQQAGDGSAF